MLHVGKLIKIPTEPLVRLRGAAPDSGSDAGASVSVTGVHKSEVVRSSERHDAWVAAERERAEAKKVNVTTLRRA